MLSQQQTPELQQLLLQDLLSLPLLFARLLLPSPRRISTSTVSSNDGRWDLTLLLWKNSLGEYPSSLGA